MSELESGEPSAESEIRVTLNGPHAVTNLPEFRNWLGEELPLKPEMELCRCGQSANKPFCDGSHAKANFSGAKGTTACRSRSSTTGASARTLAFAQTAWVLSFMLGKSLSLLRAEEGSTKSSRLRAPALR